jgi:fibronectin-binding autotransporter adhesin
MQRRMKSKVIAAVAAASGGLFTVSAKGANYVWTALAAGNASGSWATATNWTPNLPAGGTTTADTVNLSTLDFTVPSIVTLDAAQSVSVITFGDTDPTTPGNWTINATSVSPNNATNVLNLLTTANPTFNIVGNTSATINTTINNGSATAWGLAKGGAGTLTLTANNSTMTGFTYINNGTLTLDFSQAWSPLADIIGDTATGSTSAAHLELQGGTLNLIGKAGATNKQSFSNATAGTNAGIGSSTITFNQNGAASLSLALGTIGRPTVAGAGGTQKQTGATIDIQLPTTGTVSGTTAITGPLGLLTDANGSPFVTVNGGANWAAVSGGNIVAGSSVAGFYTNSTASTLAGNADLVTNTTLTAAASIASLRYNDASARTVDLGTNSLTTGGILVTPTSGGALTIQNGTMVAPNVAAADMIIDQNNTTSPMTISAAIVNNGSNAALTKNGAGTLVLSGNNTYSGDTVVNGGTVTINSGTLGIVGAPFACTQLAPAFGNSATMNIGGTAVVSDDHFAIAGNETNFAGGTAVLNQTGGSIINGAWFSVGAFGNGTYNMSGGSMTVIGGFARMEVGVFGASSGLVNMSGNAQINLENGSSLDMGSVNTTGNNTINQNGGTITFFSDAGITMGGGGALRLGNGGTGTNTYNLNGGTLNVPSIGRNTSTGVLNLNGGTIRATGTSTAFINNLVSSTTVGAVTTTVSTVNIQAGGAIIDTQAFTDTIKQPFLHAASLGATPDGGLTKLGSGTLILGTTAALTTSNTFTSTYTGPTKVSGGILQLPSNAVVPPPTPIASYSFDKINGATPTNGTELNPSDVVNNTGSGGATLNGTVNNAGYSGFGVSGLTVVAGKFGHALSFDGTGSTVDVNSNILDMSGNSTWTMSLWVQTTTAGGEFVAKTTPATGWDTGASSFYLAANPPSGTSGTFPTAVRNGGGFQQGGTAVADGAWHLLTYVDDSGLKSIYVDGSLTTATQTGFNTTDTSTGVRIGFDSDTLPTLDGNVSYVGNLDELGFYSAALTQQQVQDLFSSNTITHTTPAGGGQLLPTNTPVNLAVTGATLDLNGNNQIIGSLTGVVGSLVTLGAGNLTTGGDNTTPVTFAGNMSSTGGGLTKTGTGTFTLSGTNTYTGNTSVTGGTLVIGSTTALPVGTNLSIATSSAVTVPNHGAGAKTLLQVSSFSTTGTGTLDLSNNDMIVHNGVPANIFTELKAGFNAPVGYWNGTGGIASSAAAADTKHLTTLGFRTGGITFDSVSTTSTDVLVKYTYYGDANLDGSVNGADYQQIDLGFGSHLTGWSNGDFNYDGVVDGSDFSLIDNTFNQINASGASPLALIASSADLVASPATTQIPEPTTISVLALGAMGLMSRRHRKSDRKSV